MNILVLNCGSSSVKYKLIEIKANNVLAEGGIEKIGLPDAFIKFKLADGSKKILELDITDHDGAIKAILDLLTSAEFGCIKSFDEIEREFDGKGYGDFKSAVAEAVIECLSPIQQEYNKLIADKAYLEQCAKTGSEKASYAARKTLRKVMKKVGFWQV